MSEDSVSLNSQDEEEVDPGSRVEVLAGFEHVASPGFLTRVRRKIQRRTTTAQVAAFSWSIPALVFLELWRIAIGLLQLKDPRKGK